MPIVYFSEADQAPILAEYNKDQVVLDKIPLVPRNANTGWPLLQVSLFSPTEKINTYEPALGGGKCHFFYIGAFNFANLLLRIPGTVEITGNSGSAIERAEFNANHVANFIDAFSMHHKKYGLKISSKSGGYGKTLSIKGPEGDYRKLQNAFYDSFSYAMNKDSRIRDIADWDRGHQQHPGYTAEEITSNINTHVAVFAEGQIFVDLGKFLDHVNDQDIKDFFKNVFKVDEFQQLKKVKNFNPKEIGAEPEQADLSKTLLGKEIENLQKNKRYVDSKDAITALEKMLRELQKEPNNSDNQKIANCFIKILTRMNDPKKEKLSKDELKNEFYGLDKQLTSTIKPLLSAVVCGAILGLAGLVAGGLVGALATSWGGGFGAFAAAAIGCAVGVKIGLSVGAGTGFLTGTGVGFFTHREKLIEKTHLALKDSVKKAEHSLIEMLPK